MTGFSDSAPAFTFPAGLFFSLRSVGLWREALTAFEQGDAARMVGLTRQRIEESGEEAIRVLERRADTGAAR